MTLSQKVVWSEGMLLTQQHFQQQERYFEKLINARLGSVNQLNWGLRSIEYNKDYLAMNQFGLKDICGFFRDGTFFQTPDNAELPEPITLLESQHGTLIYLALSLSANNSQGNESNNRYHHKNISLSDSGIQGEMANSITLAKYQLKLLTEDDNMAGFTVIPIARIKSISSESGIKLDNNFIPPCLYCNANDKLVSYLNETFSLLQHYGKQISKRAKISNLFDMHNIKDLLHLQTINKLIPVFKHLTTLEELHPETLYQHMIQLVGGLSLFSADSEAPFSWVHYKHNDLTETFHWVMSEQRKILNIVVDEVVVEVPLNLASNGSYTALIHDNSLFESAQFVISINNNAMSQKSDVTFSSRVRISSMEKIADLVKFQINGLQLKPLEGAFPHIDSGKDYQYFEMLKNGNSWDDIVTAANVAIHISGNTAGLSLRLWAVKK